MEQKEIIIHIQGEKWEFPITSNTTVDQLLKDVNESISHELPNVKVIALRTENDARLPLTTILASNIQKYGSLKGIIDHVSTKKTHSVAAPTSTILPSAWNSKGQMIRTPPKKQDPLKRTFTITKWNTDQNTEYSLWCNETLEKLALGDGWLLEKENEHCWHWTIDPNETYQFTNGQKLVKKVNQQWTLHKVQKSQEQKEDKQKANHDLRTNKKERRSELMLQVRQTENNIAGRIEELKKIIALTNDAQVLKHCTERIAELDQEKQKTITSLNATWKDTNKKVHQFLKNKYDKQKSQKEKQQPAKVNKEPITIESDNSLDDTIDNEAPDTSSDSNNDEVSIAPISNTHSPAMSNLIGSVTNNAVVTKKRHKTSPLAAIESLSPPHKRNTSFQPTTPITSKKNTDILGKTILLDDENELDDLVNNESLQSSQSSQSYDDSLKEQASGHSPKVKTFRDISKLIRSGDISNQGERQRRSPTRLSI